MRGCSLVANARIQLLNNIIMLDVIVAVICAVREEVLRVPMVVAYVLGRERLLAIQIRARSIGHVLRLGAPNALIV